MGILYQLYKLYHLGVACKCYNPNWICDFVTNTLRAVLWTGPYSDFLCPEMQVVNVKLIESLSRRQTSVVVFQTCSRCRKMSYVSAKLLLYDWRKLLICNQKVLKRYANIQTSKHKTPCSFSKKIQRKCGISETFLKWPRKICCLSILSELFLRENKHDY